MFLTFIFPVWLSDIRTFDIALDMVQVVRKFVDKLENAEDLIDKIMTKNKPYVGHLLFKKWLTLFGESHMWWQEVILLSTKC